MDNNVMLNEFFSSNEWMDFLRGLTDAFDFEFSVYDEDCECMFRVNENPFCNFLRTAPGDIVECPGSCHSLIRESRLSNEPAIYKCASGLTCFAFRFERSGEKAFMAAVGGFSTYEDLLAFLKIVREHNLSGIPVSRSLDFVREDYVKAVSGYVRLSVERLQKSFHEKYRLEEKLLRITSLFDNQAIHTLSKNPELMYRYILDTIEFVFGSTSASLMVLNEEMSAYRTVTSSGKMRDAIAGIRLRAGSPAVDEMKQKKSMVFYEDASVLDESGRPEGVRSVLFLPVFTGGLLEVVIAVFDRTFSNEDMKIMNAFMNYVQLNLENRVLHAEIMRNRKADEKLHSFVNYSRSVASVMDMENLFHALLEKSSELLEAEQGSFMLLDDESSELVVEANKGEDSIVQKKMRVKKSEAISGMVLDSGESFLVKDIEQDPRIRQVNRPRYKTKSFVSIPIIIREGIKGVINLADKARGGAFNEDDLNLIQLFINNISTAIEKNLLYKKTEELQKLSITDPLTGIYNRRYLNMRLSEEITRYNRYKHPFSFMMLDLDKFKDYNDTFGHIAGDNLIKSLAFVMHNSLRTIDIAARFGGDEFVAIFPQTPKADAIQITNRLKEKIDGSMREKFSEMPLSVSMGLATYPDDASSIMELIEKTDQALYLAKKGGGNRVVYL